MLYFQTISNSFLKYYYLYFHNNKNNESYNNNDDVELPVLKREMANADLCLLMV
jgi:hypothetical protein